MTDKPAKEQASSTYSAPPPILTFGLRHLMFMVLAIAVGLAFFSQFWRPFLYFLGPLVVVAIVVGTVMVLLNWNRSHQETLLSILTIAAEERVPISTGVDAFAGLSGLWLRYKAERLARALEWGVPLPVALENHRGLLPSGSAALASVGWAQEALSLGLREALAAQANRRPYRATVTNRLLYLAAVLVGFSGINGFMMYWVLPKFRAIFDDFGITLPNLTQMAMEVSSNPIIALLAVLIALPLPVGIFVHVLSAFGFFPGGVPVLNWFVRGRHKAAVLRALAVTVDAQKPIVSGLDQMARYHPVRSTTRKLRRAIVRVEQGEDWTEALRGVGLIGGNDAALLASAQSAGNLSWALRTLADSQERRLGYHLELLSQALLPVIIVMIGALVGLTVVGYFLPLLTLMRSLAG